MFPLYGIAYLEAPSVYKTACVSVLCGWRCIVHGVVCVRVKYCGWSDLCVHVYVCRCLVWYVVQVSVVKSKHVSVMVCLSIDTTVCFLNQSLVLSLSHMRSHTHTHVLSIDTPYLFHILICFAKSGCFSHFCLHALPMESNFCIHNSSAQWGPCNEFYLATMFMFLQQW